MLASTSSNFRFLKPNSWQSKFLLFIRTCSLLCYVSAFNEICIPEVIGEPEEKSKEDRETLEGQEEVSKLSKSGSEDEVSPPHRTGASFLPASLSPILL
jgi:hypothetical protein